MRNKYQQDYYKKNKVKILKRHSKWREKNLSYFKKYRVENKEKVLFGRKKYYNQNKIIIAKKQQIWYKKNKKSQLQKIQDYRKKYPWKIILTSIKQRCNNSKNKAYKWYGGRGIKCLITADELKELWFRDKAYEMKKPSIDRKDNCGNYTFKNCQFIEQSQNSKKRVLLGKRNKIGKFIS